MGFLKSRCSCFTALFALPALLVMLSYRNVNLKLHIRGEPVQSIVSKAEPPENLHSRLSVLRPDHQPVTNDYIDPRTTAAAAMSVTINTVAKINPVTVNTAAAKINPGCLERRLNRYRAVDTGEIYHHPKIIHYAKLSPGGGPCSLNFREYTSVLSVYKFLQPEKFIFHVYTSMDGHYWEVIRQWKDVKIEVNKISRVQYIGGKPVTWIQHEADYIKLRELFHHGGIAMDFDVIIVNATRLKYEQRLSECVLSEEGEYINGGFQSCIKNSPFIKKWLEGYDTDYRPHLWLHNVSFKPTSILLDKKDSVCYNVYLDDTICVHPNWGNQREWLRKNGVQWRSKTAAHYFVKSNIQNDNEKILGENHSLAELLQYVHN